MAILYVWLWWFPRDAGAGYLFWHLLSVSLFFYAGHSLYSMPLTGLIVEATDDYHERTRIAGITLAFGFAMQVGSQWVFPLTQSKCFSDSISGVRWVSIGCGVLFLVSALIPVVLCRERLYANLASKQPRISFVESWRAACRNKPFMALLWMRSVFSFGANVVGILGAYMYTYYVFGGSIKAAAVGYAVVGSSYHVAAIVTSLAVFPQIECRLGKRCTLQIAAGVLVAGCISKIFLYQPGWTWTPLVAVACNGISNAGVSLMCIAMLGDIADYDEWQSGLRREGLFSSLLSWFDKAGNSLGFLLSGFILTWIGFDARLGAQSDHTLRLMKLIYVAAPATGAVITILLARRYDLNQNLVYDIKAEIARRRAAKGAL
jgi:GPH family glycoside/pentoside/hexuronide:cation symporter